MMDQGTRIRYEKHRRRQAGWYVLFLGMILGVLGGVIFEATTEEENIFGVLMIVGFGSLWLIALIQGSHNEGAAKAIEKEFGSPDAIFLGEEGDNLRPGDEP